MLPVGGAKPRILEALIRTGTGQWRQDYNQIQPHSALGYRPPAPEVIATLLAVAIQMAWKEGGTETRINQHSGWYNLRGQVSVVAQVNDWALYCM